MYTRLPTPNAQDGNDINSDSDIFDDSPPVHTKRLCAPQTPACCHKPTHIAPFHRHQSSLNDDSDDLFDEVPKLASPRPFVVTSIPTSSKPPPQQHSTLLPPPHQIQRPLTKPFQTTLTPVTLSDDDLFDPPLSPQHSRTTGLRRSQRVQPQSQSSQSSLFSSPNSSFNRSPPLSSPSSQEQTSTTGHIPPGSFVPPSRPRRSRSIAPPLSLIPPNPPQTSNTKRDEPNQHSNSHSATTSRNSRNKSLKSSARRPSVSALSNDRKEQHHMSSMDLFGDDSDLTELFDPSPLNNSDQLTKLNTTTAPRRSTRRFPTNSPTTTTSSQWQQGKEDSTPPARSSITTRSSTRSSYQSNALSTSVDSTPPRSSSVHRTRPSLLRVKGPKIYPRQPSSFPTATIPASKLNIQLDTHLPENTTLLPNGLFYPAALPNTRMYEIFPYHQLYNADEVNNFSDSDPAPLTQAPTSSYSPNFLLESFKDPPSDSAHPITFPLITPFNPEKASCTSMPFPLHIPTPLLGLTAGTFIKQYPTCNDSIDFLIQVKKQTPQLLFTPYELIFYQTSLKFYHAFPSSFSDNNTTSMILKFLDSKYQFVTGPFKKRFLQLYPESHDLFSYLPTPKQDEALHSANAYTSQVVQRNLLYTNDGSGKDNGNELLFHSSSQQFKPAPPYDSTRMTSSHKTTSSVSSDQLAPWKQPSLKFLLFSDLPPTPTPPFVKSLFTSPLHSYSTSPPISVEMATANIRHALLQHELVQPKQDYFTDENFLTTLRGPQPPAQSSTILANGDEVITGLSIPAPALLVVYSLRNAFPKMWMRPNFNPLNHHLTPRQYMNRHEMEYLKELSSIPRQKLSSQLQKEQHYLVHKFFYTTTVLTVRYLSRYPHRQHDTWGDEYFDCVVKRVQVENPSPPPTIPTQPTRSDPITRMVIYNDANPLTLNYSALIYNQKGKIISVAVRPPQHLLAVQRQVLTAVYFPILNAYLDDLILTKGVVPSLIFSAEENEYMRALNSYPSSSLCSQLFRRRQYLSRKLTWAFETFTIRYLFHVKDPSPRDLLPFEHPGPLDANGKLIYRYTHHVYAKLAGEREQLVKERSVLTYRERLRRRRSIIRFKKDDTDDLSFSEEEEEEEKGGPFRPTLGNTFLSFDSIDDGDLFSNDMMFGELDENYLNKSGSDTKLPTFIPNSSSLSFLQNPNLIFTPTTPAPVPTPAPAPMPNGLNSQSSRVLRPKRSVAMPRSSSDFSATTSSGDDSDDADDDFAPKSMSNFKTPSKPQSSQQLSQTSESESELNKESLSSSESYEDQTSSSYEDQTSSSSDGDYSSREQSRHVVKKRALGRAMRKAETPNASQTDENPLVQLKTVKQLSITLEELVGLFRATSNTILIPSNAFISNFSSGLAQAGTSDAVETDFTSRTPKLRSPASTRVVKRGYSDLFDSETSLTSDDDDGI